MFNLKKLLAGITFVSMVGIGSLITSMPAFAADAVLYDFSGLDIPAGLPATVQLDPALTESFKYDDAAIAAYVQDLAAKYSTSYAQIDQAKEIEYLKGVANGNGGGAHRAFYIASGAAIPADTSAASVTYVQEVEPIVNNSEPVTAIPDASALATQQALNYIAENEKAKALEKQAELAATPNMNLSGGTYIDVNKGTQTLTLFVGGTPAYVTPVVTGCLNAGHSTPNGVYSVYNKEVNRTLKGDNYTSFVRYWMPFYKGYGIHDANWRDSFGGDIYVRSGSHGCVNIPPSNMPTLYASVNVGTTVYVHD
ncbi:MAG: L,D-transpeptidase [Lachnospiraceae bacterium]|nr:L,D-transpeptidase [Lachnospiraceae bacterium]